MERLDEELLETIADLHGVPEGSFNIRKNGKLLARNTNTDIEIVSKTDKDGIDIIVKPGVKGKSVHIPVLLTVGDFHDLVYNDFYIGDNADVTIIAGCGIHNDTCGDSVHDGIHTFTWVRMRRFVTSKNTTPTAQARAKSSLCPSRKSISKSVPRSPWNRRSSAA